MIETLLGLPGRVSALLGRLTETRANNLDRLDAAVTTRAPSATALSNLVWTDAIAAKLGAMHVETPPTALPAPWILPSGVTYAGSETITAISGSFAVAYSRSGAGSLRMLAFKGISVLTSGNLSGEQMAQAFVAALPGMRQHLSAHRRPFIARVTAQGSVELIALKKPSARPATPTR